MARADIDPEERNDAVVTLTQLWDCVACLETDEVIFSLPAGVDAEDLAQTPSRAWACPACGRVQEVEYTGWTIRDES